MRIKKTGKTTEKLLKSLEQLDDESIEVGHFRSQGTHSDSGLTYPELLALWHYGAVEGQEENIRSPLLNFEFTELQTRKLSSSPEFKIAMNKWAKNVLTASSDDQLLEDVGMLAAKRYQAVFGVVGQFMPPDSTGTPMLESGELKDATAYKTSKSNVVKEV